MSRIDQSNVFNWSKTNDIKRTENCGQVELPPSVNRDKPFSFGELTPRYDGGMYACTYGINCILGAKLDTWV